MADSVLVTGGSDRAVRWLTGHLDVGGWDVTCVDLSCPDGVDARDRVAFRAADLTDQSETAELVRSVDPDAVVHWTALPSPERHAGMRVFENEVTSAYNVLTAAGRNDARIAWASSESAYGLSCSAGRTPPEYLPVDEEHPRRPEDPHGTAKVVGEEIAGMVARRHDVPIASLRSSWVQYPGDYDCRDVRGDLAAGAGNCWSYVDVRDLASAVERSLAGDFDGHEPYLVAAADNYLDRPIEQALRKTFDQVPEECAVSGDDSALSTAKAQSTLDWRPVHSWRDAAKETDVTPPTE